MSRRYNRAAPSSNLDEGRPTSTQAVSWDDPIDTWRYPGYTWAQWQDAFAWTTLAVAQRVWAKQGSKLYALHRDKLLRDDLHSWLLVEAQTIANKYCPDPRADDPERYWGAWLYRALDETARWHFGQQVGGDGTRSREVWRSGIASNDEINDREDETGARVNRHPLHGHDLLQQDPAVVVIRLEDLARENRDIERYLRDHGTYATSTTYAKGAPCLVNLCTQPASARGLCRQHYEAEHRTSKSLSCTIPDCTGAHRGHGLCGKHIQQWRAGILAPELHQYVETSRKTGPTAPAGAPICSVDGCDNVRYGRGKKPSVTECARHYQERRDANRAAS